MLKGRIADLNRQLDETKSEIAVADMVKESVIELERRNTDLKSELRTLQHLLNETVQDSNSSRTKYEHEIARIKAVVGQVEAENRGLRNAAAAGGGGGGGGLDADKDALMAFSDATKSLARKMKSNFQTAVTNMDPKSPLSDENHTLSENGTNPEAQLQKAQEDTELLKSIVEPLEEQIGALKEKARCPR